MLKNFRYDIITKNTVCGIVYNGNNYYFQKNLQGDVISITDHSGDTIATYSYDAWGKCTVLQDNSYCSIATVNPYRYRGYYFDQETGLYYLQSRYYDPEIGRFINADAPDYVAVTGGNLFNYCANCPTKNADYTGFCYTPTYDEDRATSKPKKESKKKKSFSRDWLALGIDVIATLLMPYAVAPYDVMGQAFGFIVEKFSINVIWSKLISGIVPKVVGIFSKFLTTIRTVIWRITGYLLSFLHSEMVSGIMDKIIKLGNNSTIDQLWNFITMFLSFGSMIAGIVDLSDGNFDGYITFS